MQLGQTKLAGGWDASTRTSPAEISRSSSHFVQHLPGLEHCVQVWSQLYRKDVDWLDRVQREATKMSKEGGTFTYGERERIWLVQP